MGIFIWKIYGDICGIDEESEENVNGIRSWILSRLIFLELDCGPIAGASLPDF